MMHMNTLCGLCPSVRLPTCFNIETNEYELNFVLTVNAKIYWADYVPVRMGRDHQSITIDD
jgi:hypothetical protein